jgi:hypothetical protein
LGIDRSAPAQRDFAAWVRKNRLAVSAVHVSLFVSAIILIERGASGPAQGFFQFGKVCGVRNAEIGCETKGGTGYDCHVLRAQEIGKKIAVYR